MASLSKSEATAEAQCVWTLDVQINLPTLLFAPGENQEKAAGKVWAMGPAGTGPAPKGPRPHLLVSLPLRAYLGELQHKVQDWQKPRSLICIRP